MSDKWLDWLLFGFIATLFIVGLTGLAWYVIDSGSIW